MGLIRPMNLLQNTRKERKISRADISAKKSNRHERDRSQDLVGCRVGFRSRVKYGIRHRIERMQSVEGFYLIK